MTKTWASSLQRRRLYLLSLLIGTLSATVILKFGEIQYLEIVLAADALILFGLFCYHRLRVQVFKPFLSIGVSYAVFMALALALSFFALQQTFYAQNFTFLKRPLLVTISRMGELTLDVGYMLYMASLYREDEKLCRFGALTYYWTAVAGGIYAIVCFPLNYFFEMQAGTYTVSHRLRGFNNEGGSYGTYMITVCLLTVAMYHRKWLSQRQFRLSIGLFFVCLVGSQSKAAMFAVAMVTLFHFIWAASGVKRIAIIAAVLGVFAIFASLINIAAKVDVYLQSAAEYQKVSNLRSNDGNYVMGRVAGMVLAPRMIAAHPLAGIGWGNYPLVRDDPAYRQGTAYSLASVDSPSLGPIDYIVDLGFPLFIYMTWISLKPAYLLRRHRADPWLISLAMMQPVAVWFGAHLNLTYQWVVVGLALGMGFANRNKIAPEVAE